MSDEHLSRTAQRLRGGDSPTLFVSMLNDEALLYLAAAIRVEGAKRYGWHHAYCQCDSCPAGKTRCMPTPHVDCPREGTWMSQGGRAVRLCEQHAVHDRPFQEGENRIYRKPVAIISNTPTGRSPSDLHRNLDGCPSLEAAVGSCSLPCFVYDCKAPCRRGPAGHDGRCQCTPHANTPGRYQVAPEYREQMSSVRCECSEKGLLECWCPP